MPDEARKIARDHWPRDPVAVAEMLRELVVCTIQQYALSADSHAEYSALVAGLCNMVDELDPTPTEDTRRTHGPR